ncbi:hypothetical protein LIER_37752 [Lithospermum erythrorhizon]|uniref:DUF7806 domain-containing protein n=1 Tax=Lithospermum erythrorhizon TaxID=34254 RepID=A0AAV3PRR3_LITER
MAEIQMQALYSKLYTKYSKLKKEKDHALEKLNRNQEVKFLKYHEVAEEMIEYLKGVNERLELQINDLQNEMASIRSTKDEKYLEFQKLWMEERQKNTKLLEEIDRLKNLEQEEPLFHGDDGKAENELLTTPGSGAEPSLFNKLATKIKRKLMHVVENPVDPSAGEEPMLIAEDESANRLCKRMKMNGYSPNSFQPTCCKKVVAGSAAGANAGFLNCVFQDLVECIVGMKFSVVSQEEFCVLASHQSTGYSFSLTWIKDSSGELQLRYHVLSLGTLERVAPEWMKETITFGLSMCTIFFERMCRIVKF